MGRKKKRTAEFRSYIKSKDNILADIVDGLNHALCITVGILGCIVILLISISMFMTGTLTIQVGEIPLVPPVFNYILGSIFFALSVGVLIFLTKGISIYLREVM